MVINRVNICYGDNDDKNNIDIEWGITREGWTRN